jgi:hypothetical protein
MARKTKELIEEEILKEVEGGIDGVNDDPQGGDTDIVGNDSNSSSDIGVPIADRYYAPVDLLLVDKGESRDEGDDRYLVIISEGSNLIDTEGNTTSVGRKLVVDALDTLAVKSGATVISESGCVDGNGDVSIYSDDSVSAYGDGFVYLYSGEGDPQLKYLIDKGYLVSKKDLAIDHSLSTAGPIDGSFKQPVESLVIVAVDWIVKLLQSKYAWAASIPMFIQFIVKSVAFQEGLSNLEDKIFEGVNSKISEV